MEKKRPGIMLYFSLHRTLAQFSYEEIGKLLMAMLNYGETGEVPELDSKLSVAWEFLRYDIDKDGERYESVTQKRKEAAEKRWNANDANASKSMQTMQMHDLNANDANDANSNSNSNSNSSCNSNCSSSSNSNSSCNTKKNNKGVFQEFAGDDKDLLNALKEFYHMRSISKAPMTEEAQKRLLNKLQKYPRDDWIPILNQSCNNNWKDIYQLKGDEPSSGRGKPVYPNAQKGASSIPDGIKWYDNT